MPTLVQARLMVVADVPTAVSPVGAGGTAGDVTADTTAEGAEVPPVL